MKTNPEAQEAQRKPRKKITPPLLSSPHTYTYIIFKLTKSKDNVKMLKEAREGRDST